MTSSVSLAEMQRRAQPAATVLVVDDDGLVREMMSAFLSMKGYRVIEAGTADEAVAVLLGTSLVDVVFTDVRMPGQLDGLGLARWVRDHRPQTRVLITSGRASGAQQAAELSSGPLILKPYHPELVVQRVQALTGRSGTQ
jgi:DNA-binding response OmpR family regulator